MWTFTGYCTFFCLFAVNSVNLSPTMAHSFPKEKLKTVESQLSDASREQDPTCNGMARHGCVFGQCRPMILKGTGFDLKALYVPFLSMFRFWYLCQTLHCQPLHRKASNLHPSRCQSRVAFKYIPYCAGRCQKTAGRICSVYTCNRKSRGGRNADSHVVQLCSREPQIPRPG